LTDIAITAANVVAGSGVKITGGTAGVAITAGQWLYLDPTTGKYALADNNSATAAQRVPSGVALNNAAANQPVDVQQSGPYTVGGTLVAGVAYYQSANPGGMCAVADLVTGMYPCILGIATSTTVLNINIQASGVVLP
jgi:hypothetical protein